MRLFRKSILLILLLNLFFNSNSQILIDFQKEIPSEIYGGITLENDNVYGKVARLKEKAVNLNTEKLLLNSNISFAIWVKPTHLREKIATIIGSSKNFNLGLLPSGSIQFHTFKDTFYDTKCVMDANSWQHVGFTISEDMQLCIYYNGSPILDAEITDSLELSFENLVLCNDDYDTQFTGLFTKVFVSDKVLSQEEFKTLYQTTLIAPPLNLGLKAYYPLDGSKKNLITQSEDASYQNIELTTDSVRGNVVVFSNEESQIRIPGIDYDNQFTIALWAKPTNIDLGRSVFLGSKEFTYIMNLCDDNKMVLNVPYHFFTKIEVPDIDYSKWNHFAVTVQFNESAYFYINGNYIGKCLAMERSTPEEYWVMGNSIWKDNYFGHMSELIFWNRALLPSEIKDIYNGKVFQSIEEIESSKIVYILLIVLLIAGIIAYLFIPKKKRIKKVSSIKTDLSTKNAIYLLNEFRAFDKFGNDLSMQLTPRLVQIFSLILLFPIHHKQYIKSDTISEIIWGVDDKKRSKSNRNSNISRLKKVLENIDGCELIYENKYWRINVSEGCFIDVLNLVNNFDQQNFNQLTSGKFCKELQQANFDGLISFLNNLFIDKLQFLIGEAKGEKEYHTCIVLSDFWMSIDDLSKDALTAKVNALRKLDRLREAEATFEKFASTYQQVLNQQVDFSLSSLLS